MRINSIRARFQVLLSIIFITIVMVAAYRAWERRNTDLGMTIAQMQARVQLLTSEQAEAVRHAQNLLAVLRTTQNLDALSRQPDCAVTLDTIARLDPHLATIMLIAPDGSVQCDRSGRPAINVSGRSYWQPALRNDGPVVGAPLWGRISTRWVLPVAQRYHGADGSVAGVIMAALDLSRMQRSLHKAAFFPDTRLELLSPDGSIVASLDPPGPGQTQLRADPVAWSSLLTRKGRGSAILHYGGETRIHVFDRIVETVDGPVYLWSSVPEAQATARASNQWRSAVGIALVVIIIAFTVTWLGGRHWLVAPLEHIASVARRLSSGDFEARTGMDHDRGEIGRLARAVDEMAQQLGRYDHLTGLFNLRSFEEGLEQDIHRAKEHDLSIAVLQIAIVDFHHLESSLGQQVGRALLREVGSRLQALSASRGIVARISDSSFAMAIPGLAQSADILNLIDEMRAELCQDKLVLFAQEILLALRFGICMYPEDGQSAAVLTQRAGLALDHVDPKGRTCVQFYRQEMNEHMQRRIAMAARMREAIVAQEFVVHYQPQLDLASSCVIGLEALVRWKQGDGCIPPADFIPLAEENGLIVPLGRWVLQEALQQFRRWQDQHGMDRVTLAVNVSAVQLANPEFVTHVGLALQMSGVAADRLELELTESQLMTSARDTMETIRQLKLLGVQLSIDDFGTGYSSLAYLKHFNVDKLKIDKSFIDHLTTDDSDTAIVQATIAMGHKLGLTVVAEGVESAEQLDYLRSLACDQIQGYFFSRPLPAALIPDFLLQATISAH